MDDAAREHGSVALVVLDIDRFKKVKDTYGHPFGDQILVAVADALKAVVRSHDTAARIGGREFALLLPGATLDEELEVAERARAMIAANTLPDGEGLSCSAGVAATRGENTSDFDLFDHMPTARSTKPSARAERAQRWPARPMRG